MTMFGKMMRVLVALFLISLLHDVAGAEIPRDSSERRGIKNITTLREMKRRYVTFQQYDFSCGAAVISTLLTYYFGEPATEQEVVFGIAQRADVEKVLKRRAFSLLDMKKFAQSRGYRAIGYQMDFDFLVELKKPVIVPVEIRSYKHFVIFKGIVGDRVVIADPAFGNYTMKFTRFLSIWTDGIGFVLERNEPKGPFTEEDLGRQARFMTPQNLRVVVTASGTPAITPIPGQVQLIRGPTPTGGSFLEFFNIQVPPVGLPVTPSQ
jgi:predicted double-glycine peptidase